MIAGSGSAVEAVTERSGDMVLDNGLLRVELDGGVGVRRIHDHRHGVEVIGPGGLCAEVLDDRSDTWSHGVVGFGSVIGSFELQRINRIEHGPVRSAIRIESTFGSSSLAQDIVLYRAAPYVDGVTCRLGIDSSRSHPRKPGLVRSTAP